MRQSSLLFLVGLVFLTACQSQTQPTAGPNLAGCPASYDRQTVEVNGTASQVTFGFLRFTTVEDSAHGVCVIHSDRFVGDNSAKVHLVGLIALPPHGVWTKPFLMFKDEYDALPASEQ